MLCLFYSVMMMKMTSYLQQQNELREALDRFHHQTVQSDSVWTGRLLLLKDNICQT